MSQGFALKLETREIVVSNGWISGRGWALGPAPIDAVSIFHGSERLCQAIVGAPSPDAASYDPRHPHRDRAGFIFTAPLPVGLKDTLELRVHVTAGEAEAETSVKFAVKPAPEPGTNLAEPVVTDPAALRRIKRPRLPPMRLELEGATVNARGVLRVEGWVVSLSPIEEVAVFLGKRRLGLAERNVSRDDVGNVHPDYPDARTAGFLFLDNVEDGDAPLGTEPVRIVATAVGGIVREAVGSLAVSPQLRRGPAEQDRVIHVFWDNVSLGSTGRLEIEGWAVCPSGLASIDIDLDEQALGTAEIGRDRPDVGNQFPGVPGARQAGFRFVRSLDRPMEGEHVVGLTVRGQDGEERVSLIPAQVQLQAEPDAASAATTVPIRLFLDTPAIKAGHATQEIRGFLSINGWAIASAGVTAIEVFLDGIAIGEATRGIRREDIKAAFPDEPDALRCGFAMMVPPQKLRPGAHEVNVVVRDRLGRTAETSFGIVAQPDVEQPGPWLLRRKVPFAEIRMNQALVARAGEPAPLTIVIRPPLRQESAEAKLKRTLQSLERQVWREWRAVVLSTPSRMAIVSARLAKDFPEFSDRLQVMVPEAASPLASLAPDRDRSYVMVLTAGDELGADAVMEFAVEAAMHPDATFLYSDERRRDPGDGVMKAFFKPDWSPELQEATNYIGRAWAVRRNLLVASGATTGSLDQGDYALVLKLTELATDIRHIRKVLCERGARELDEPARERLALAQALDRRGRSGSIVPGLAKGSWRIARQTSPAGLVSILIPTAGSRDLIRQTIQTIREKTVGVSYEIICLDNIPEARTEAKAWLAENADRVVGIQAPFNWSLFNNQGARRARGDFLLFLNDDVEVTSPDWLGIMLELAERAEIGVVGPQLLYPDSTVQHAGMFLANGHARHAFRFLPHDEPGPFGLALTQRDVASVTGACMLVRRAVFDELTGFDERHGVVNNDVDFCLRARRAGYRIVYTPNASLIHHEMASREHLKDTFQKSSFLENWGVAFAEGDPFFHPRLALDADQYLPDPEPTEIIHVGHPVFERDRIGRILVVKLDHIGDFLTAVPAIRLLKTRFPTARISVLCARGSLAIARAMPEIEEAIEFNLFHARSERGARTVLRAEWDELKAGLRARHFDLAIDLRIQPDTRQILASSGAAVLAGFAHRTVQTALDVSLPWEGDSARERKTSHVVDRLCQLVEAVAIAGSPSQDGLALSQFPAAAASVIATISDFRNGLYGAWERPLLCVHPGVGNAARQWPAENFATLIDMFAELDQAGAVLIGGPDEAKIAKRVLRSVRHPRSVLSLVGGTSVSDLPGVLRACDLYIGNNSGPQHLAASLGMPTLGIHSGVVDATEWGPFGASGAAIRRLTTCSPCYLSKRSDCPRNMTCLDDLRPGEVYRAAKRLLAVQRDPATPISATATERRREQRVPVAT